MSVGDLQFTKFNLSRDSLKSAHGLSFAIKWGFSCVSRISDSLRLKNILCGINMKAGRCKIYASSEIKVTNG